MKILMVCLGNICRSPMAEGVLQNMSDKAGLNWIIESAGTNGFHFGEAPHHFSQKATKKKGIDISRHKSRKFIPEYFLIYDKIYAMSTDVIVEMKQISGKKFIPEKVSLLLDEVFPGQDADVPDPWYGPEAGFYDACDLIEGACEKIIEKAL